MSFGQTKIQLTQENGIYTIPCHVNGIDTKFYFDTGASDVSLSFEYFEKAYKDGNFKDYDILPEIINFKLADGSVSQAQRINIRELKIGNITLKNVIASVSLNLKAPMLLGQSALRKFGSFSFNYDDNSLTISNKSMSEIPFTRYEENRETRIKQMNEIDGLAIQCEAQLKLVKSIKYAIEDIIVEPYRINLNKKSNGDKILNIECDITNNSNLGNFVYTYLKAEIITAEGRTYSKKVIINNLEVGATSSDNSININIRDNEPKFLRLTIFFDVQIANQILSTFCQKYK